MKRKEEKQTHLLYSSINFSSRIKILPFFLISNNLVSQVSLYVYIKHAVNKGSLFFFESKTNLFRLLICVLICWLELQALTPQLGNSGRQGGTMSSLPSWLHFWDLVLMAEKMNSEEWISKYYLLLYFQIYSFLFCFCLGML